MGVTMSDPTDRPFTERFLAFYDSCSAEEQALLDYLASAGVALGPDGDDAEVEGFQAPGAPAPRPVLPAGSMGSYKLMGEILSNVSKTRSEISMTFARNARA
jgi:hypothetical protein